VFSADGTRILTASKNKTAWDANGKPLATLDGHAAGINSAVFSSDGKRILTASIDQTARLWDGVTAPWSTRRPTIRRHASGVRTRTHRSWSMLPKSACRAA
jgi:WD40 repeat protein